MNTQRIAELIDDFAPLRALPAFQSFEQELAQVVTAQKWTTPVDHSEQSAALPL